MILKCVFAGYTVYVGHLSPSSMPCIPVLISSAQPERVIIVSTMTFTTVQRNGGLILLALKDLCALAFALSQTQVFPVNIENR